MCGLSTKTNASYCAALQRLAAKRCYAATLSWPSECAFKLAARCQNSNLPTLTWCKSGTKNHRQLRQFVRPLVAVESAMLASEQPSCWPAQNSCWARWKKSAKLANKQSSLYSTENGMLQNHGQQLCNSLAKPAKLAREQSSCASAKRQSSAKQSQARQKPGNCAVCRRCPHCSLLFLFRSHAARERFIRIEMQLVLKAWPPSLSSHRHLHYRRQ